MKKWRAKYGEEYFCIEIFSGEAYISQYISSEDSIDRAYYKSGNFFRYKKDAEKKLTAIKILLKSK